MFIQQRQTSSDYKTVFLNSDNQAVIIKQCLSSSAEQFFFTSGAKNSDLSKRFSYNNNRVIIEDITET